MDKLYSILLLFGLVTIGCGGQRTNIESLGSADTTVTRKDNQENTGQVEEKIYYDSSREKLRFEISDTIKRSKSFYLSNRQTKDFFHLTINPGLINKSKSELKIFQLDSIPSSGPEVYDRYLATYRKSFTQNQYDFYVKEGIDIFFEAVYFIK